MERAGKREKRHPLFYEVYGLLSLGAAVFILLILLSYNPLDPSFNRLSSGGGVKNLGGLIGSYLSDLLLTVTGVSAIIIPLFFLFLALSLFLKKGGDLKRKTAGFLFLLLFAAPLLHISMGEFPTKGGDIEAGGVVGMVIGEISVRYLAKTGAYIFLILFLLLSIVLTFGLELSRYSGRFLLLLSRTFGLAISRVYQEARAGIAGLLKGSGRLLSTPFKRGRGVSAKRRRAPARVPVRAEGGEEIRPSGEVFVKDGEGGEEGPPGREEEGEEMGKEEQAPAGGALDDIPLPDLSLLDEPERVGSRDNERIIQDKIKLLEKRLLDYGVEGRVTGFTSGPIITVFEFEPGPGVKVNKIVNLSDDIALSMKSSRVRIVAPIPGKSVVGIEIPNEKREIVYLKDILSSDEFQTSKATLPLPLGNDTEGKPCVIDLVRMPHILIGGTTGSGKSVFINSVIQALLFRRRADEVRLILIDPKMLEFNAYDRVPHLLFPVVKSPKKASLALKWTLNEMMGRYRVLARKGSRNIKNYNEKVFEEWQERDEAGNPPVGLAFSELQRFGNDEGDLPLFKLPYVVTVIDELADLMMASPREVQDSIIRLAQMARAAGIHLIVATQRPSVDVITGLIKANFPARISFQVSSRTDSKIILDQNGGESLLGDGDMLFLPPGTSKLKRIHGAYVSEGEVKRVTSFLKRYGEPLYLEGALEMLREEGEGEEEEVPDLLERDEKYEEALRVASELGQISISMLQRRLGVGFNRAARIVEKMEDEGLVGPSDGSRPRDVYVSRIMERDSADEV